MKPGALAALALTVVACGPRPLPTPAGENAKQLWIAPNGSLVDLYLSDIEPNPF